MNAVIGSPGTVVALCYAVGLSLAALIGDGPAGAPLLALGFPVALGLLLRFGRELTMSDAAVLVAAHAAVATLHGDPTSVWIWALLYNLVAIACGSLLFARLRAAGWLVSASRVGLAASLVAVVAPLAAASIDLLGMAAEGDLSLAGLAVRWCSGAVGSALVLQAVLSYGRGFGQVAAMEPGDDEPQPGRVERVAASLLLCGLALAVIESGRLEMVLGLSFVILWFAVRLGLFATALATLAVTAFLLAVAPAGRWPTFLAGADPLSSELLRYLVLALLAAPGLFAATMTHDQTRLRRLYAYRSRHDAMTALFNRSRFLEALDAASEAARGRGKRFALLLIDLDNFKPVNDTYGHARGDALLIEIASRLRESVRVTDLVARIGGDEFAIVAPVPTVNDAMSLAKRLVETVNTPCELDGVTLKPSITLGGVLAPDSGVEARELMLLADGALYEAKRAGRNCWRFAATERVRRPEPILRDGDHELVLETVLLD